MNILYLKGKEAPKAKSSQMETMVFTREEIMTWKIPSFQRPVRINNKVLEVVEQIKRDGGIIPGIMTLGRLGNDKTFYLVDGQHRIEAFKLSELKECLADVRSMHFESMADMANEFVRLNGRLVNMRPDDILRGLEESYPNLRRVRASCDFVTYGQIVKRETLRSVIGMSQLLRCWSISRMEVPSSHAPTATALVEMLDAEEADKVIVFMQTARSAWRDDLGNARLWGSLNMVLCMWLWRRLVLNKERGLKRAIVISPDEFRKCLLSVSANADYMDWLVGRQIGERDRAPGYMRLRNIFVKRLEQEGKGAKGKVMLPSPNWVSR